MERKLAEWRAERQAEERPHSGGGGGSREEAGESRGLLSGLRARLGLCGPRGTGPERPAEEEEEERESGVNRENVCGWLCNGFVARLVKTDHSILTNVTFLKFLLWLVLLGLFIELEFGLVYFLISMFYWIYVGTRDSSKKKEGEASAYSVFNPGCEAIEGSLTAEQFERELQYRPLAGR
uniref:SAYSvFN domain-containing protein n=1 Tax=Callorhinchus milii TaxID=7868 RepID=A0A4W3J7B4_CALMI|eukprot:gi/632947565/ref/XP_007889110.1/ PREDICTED: SAYSvFN domain-containing protein 1 [Callorhinchus milii]